MKKILYSVCFLFSTGLIAQTTWQEIAVPTTKNLNTISFGTPEVGYIGGDDSLLLKTTNGGVTWNEISYTGITFLPGGEHFMELDFVTAELGFATVGPYSGVYRTADGGLTWTQLTTSGTLCYNHGLYFFADGEGFVGGAGCFQGEKMDKFIGGVSSEVTINTPSWQATDLIVDIDFDLDFFGSQGLAVSAGGRVLRTTDSGLTWDTIPTPLGNSVPLTSVTIVSSTLAYAGYDNGSGIGGLLISTDGGLTWTFDSNTATFYYPIFHDVHTTTLDRTYSGTTSTTLNSGLIMESDISGVWNYYPVDEPIYSMTSYNDTVVWGVGKNGYVVTNAYAGQLSTNESAMSEKINLYPNPATEEFSVVIPADLNGANFHLEIYSMEGKIVKSCGKNETTVDISDLNSGQYLVKVMAGTTTMSTTLLKL